MKRLSLIVLSALMAVSLSAEPTSVFGRGLFRYAQFGHSLYADMHPNFPRMDIPYATNNAVYDYGSHTGQAYRWQTMGLFGLNLPIWYNNLGDSTFALSVNMHLSANLWMDFYEFSTSPIVDTDYRIGLPTVTFLHRLNRGFAKNYSIQWSPFKHESTHIGDELQIRYIDRDYALRRVNVSYNYTEFIFTFNEAEDRLAQNHCFRLGLMLLWHGGWFNMDPDGGDASIIDPEGTAAVPYVRRSPWELYLQYQYQSPTSKHGFQGIASAEIRNRECYGFDLGVTNSDNPKNMQPESRVFTYNIFVGARYNTPTYDGPFSRIALGVRAYHGNCPYGQFRSIRNYSQIGVCLMFE
ncbi:MAG: hypothetical protein J6T80_03620 [Paludibacteraceae bacterium]|nr:hypothetical protein [Paludibacteraceae bacterium]